MRSRLVIFLVSLAALLAVAPAHAAFPGANGKIAFQRSGDILAINPDGTGETQLTSGAAFDAHPAWSPDGRKLTFSLDSSIYVMNADGTGVVRLTNNNPSNDFGPTWSPDGQQIAFNRFHDVGRLDIYVMNADGSGLRQLTTSGDSRDATWSPDGQKIAFTGPTGKIETVNAADGSGGTALTSGGNYDADSNPNWSPDGSKIAFDRLGSTDSDGDRCCPDVFVINSDGSGELQLTNNFYSLTPAWSPDGSKIAFDHGGLWVMNANGTAQASLTTTPDLRPDWQPLPTALQSATSVTSALIPVYRQCGTGGNPVNASHGPPALSGSPSDSSCTPAAFTGTARMGPLAAGTAAITAIPGDLTTTANEADDRFQVALNDVRTAAGADYNPNGAGADMTLVERLRITDNYNCAPSPCSGPYNKRATVTDFDFSVPVDCVNTASNGVGASCSVNTTVNALIPNAIKEGKQGVLSVFRLRLNDSGPDGVRGTSDDKLFAQQGVFNP